MSISGLNLILYFDRISLGGKWIQNQSCSHLGAPPFLFLPHETNERLLLEETLKGFLCKGFWIFKNASLAWVIPHIKKKKPKLKNSELAFKERVIYLFTCLKNIYWAAVCRAIWSGTEVQRWVRWSLPSGNSLTNSVRKGGKVLWPVHCKHLRRQMWVPFLLALEPVESEKRVHEIGFEG